VRRAVQAGLEITREVARLSEQAERRFGIEIAVRIGVHRGLAYLDTAQDDVYGLAANLAARVSGLAPGPPADRGGRTRGRDAKVVPIGIAQEKTPVWRGAGRPKAKSTRRIRTWNWGRQMAFVNHFYFYLWAPDWGGAFWKTSASRRFCDPADRLRGDGHDPRQLGAEQTRTPRPYPVGGDGLRNRLVVPGSQELS
jgi:hypothetical protein